MKVRGCTEPAGRAQRSGGEGGAEGILDVLPLALIGALGVLNALAVRWTTVFFGAKAGEGVLDVLLGLAVLLLLAVAVLDAQRLRG